MKMVGMELLLRPDFVCGGQNPPRSFYKKRAICHIVRFFAIKCSMKKILLCGARSFYFVGIGGVSMSALAKILISMGYTVCGSDRCESDYTAQFAARGVSVTFGADDEIIDDCDALVYTDAIKKDDPHILRAINGNKIIIPRGRLLAAVAQLYDCTIAVAGCHGKTTCTCMLAHIFACADKPFTAHIGGNDLSFGNCRLSGNQFFITEACEYNKNFLLLQPDIGVVLNSDADHLECYGDGAHVIKAYRQFSEGCKKWAGLYGDPCGRADVTFGPDESADYRAARLRSEGGRYVFDVFECGRFLCRVRLNVYGRHNVFNALAAVAAARLAGIRPEAIEGGLARFSGVERRFEKIGDCGGCEVIADYAHHPREIAAALRTAAEITRGEIYVIFQPHTYSRTKNLFGDFVGALSGIKHLLIYKTFAAREYFDAEGSALTLSNAIKNSRYAECERDIKHFVKDAGGDDKILVLGAGNIYDIAKKLFN